MNKITETQQLNKDKHDSNTLKLKKEFGDVLLQEVRKLKEKEK